MGRHSKGTGPLGLFGIEGQMAMADGDSTVAYEHDFDADESAQMAEVTTKENKSKKEKEPWSLKKKAGVVLGGAAAVTTLTLAFVADVVYHNNKVRERQALVYKQFADEGIPPSRVIADTNLWSTGINQVRVVFDEDGPHQITAQVTYDGLYVPRENGFDSEEQYTPLEEPASKEGLARLEAELYPEE